MELIIIAIIGIVLIISICICVCILGQTLAVKRRQPNHPQPHFNTDTLQPQPAQYGDGGHIMTCSWMCAYPGEKPAPATQYIWETPLPLPSDDQTEGDYTLPANMRHTQEKVDQQAEIMAQLALPENIEPASQMLTSTVSDGEYTAPVTMKADDQEHATAVPSQPMPEYTLSIKKEMRESPAHSTEVSAAEDDYLLPSTGRPEPVGANDAPQPSVFEGTSLKNAVYRPDSTLVEEEQEYINMKEDSTHDALLQ